MAGDVAIRDLVVEIEVGGSFGLHLLDMGGALGRVTLDVTLHEGARFDLNAALLGSGAQTIELVTRVTHAQPGAVSRQTVRAIAAGTATTSYLGQVRVARDAQQTDAAQSFKAMLLGRGATANAKPELEIFADDVKCAHGASIGELDTQALFYMPRAGSIRRGPGRCCCRPSLPDCSRTWPTRPSARASRAAALTRLEAMG